MCLATVALLELSDAVKTCLDIIIIYIDLM